MFKIAWARFSKEYEGIKVRSDDLVDLFKVMDGKIGLKVNTCSLRFFRKRMKELY